MNELLETVLLVEFVLFAVGGFYGLLRGVPGWPRWKACLFAGLFFAFFFISIPLTIRGKRRK